MWEGKKAATDITKPVQKMKEKNYLSEVGFEPTPTRVDCDLNAAP